MPKKNKKLHLIVPMAGNATRFAKAGALLPKPLLLYQGHPFFWWAVESVRHAQPFSTLTFVVQQQHITLFSLDQEIRNYYPDAQIIALEEITSGAAETAAFGAEYATDEAAVAFLDCDLAFDIQEFQKTLDNFDTNTTGALCVFNAISPAYSYVQLDTDGCVLGTVEKQPVSNFAIAGFYLFSSAAIFRQYYDLYKNACPYDELFLSGIYNLMIQQGHTIDLIHLLSHISLGTPQELEQATLTNALPQWYKTWK